MTRATIIMSITTPVPTVITMLTIEYWVMMDLYKKGLLNFIEPLHPVDANGDDTYMQVRFNRQMSPTEIFILGKLVCS